MLVAKYILKFYTRINGTININADGVQVHSKH